MKQVSVKCNMFTNVLSCWAIVAICCNWDWASIFKLHLLLLSQPSHLFCCNIDIPLLFLGCDHVTVPLSRKRTRCRCSSLVEVHLCTLGHSSDSSRSAAVSPEIYGCNNGQFKCKSWVDYTHSYGNIACFAMSYGCSVVIAVLPLHGCYAMQSTTQHHVRCMAGCQWRQTRLSDALLRCIWNDGDIDNAVGSWKGVPGKCCTLRLCTQQAHVLWYPHEDALGTHLLFCIDPCSACNCLIWFVHWWEGRISTDLCAVTAQCYKRIQMH